MSFDSETAATHHVWACSTCGNALLWRPHRTHGLLECQRCAFLVPVVEGFPLFGECWLDDGGDHAARLERLAGEAFGTPAEYQRFLLAKARSQVRDAYAAFQPFNESTRTWCAFVPQLRSRLRPGDVIVDLADRGGWSGEMLAQAFPDQQVISLWEGNRDVLGYRGFRHWLPAGQRPANLCIAFHHPGQPLPLASGRVALVHGYDTLHRYRQEALLPEVLRICAADGWILFPHVHTANGQPDPWFERDGLLRHGRAYRHLFGRLLAAKEGREAVMLGEAALFTALGGDAPPARLVDDSATSDYNAVLAVVPSAALGSEFAAEPLLPTQLAGAAVLVNPLLRIDALDGSVALDHLSPQAAHLLPRHPVYAQRLARRLPARLDARERLVVYLAGRLADVAAIARYLDLTVEELRPTLLDLAHREVLRVLTLSPGANRLHRLHAEGASLPWIDEDCPELLWKRALACFSERMYLIDDQGGGFTYAEADQAVTSLARRLRALGVAPGSRVVLATGLCAEAILLFWAASLRGATVIACDPALDAATRATIAAAHAPRVALVRADGLAGWEMPGTEMVHCDSGSGAAVSGAIAFSEWLRDEDFDGPDPGAAADPALPGAMLFTSGSTGRPKGVLLSRSALARSGRLVANRYHWSESDRLLSLGGMHTMSGLRNPCLAAVAAGAAVVLPGDGVGSSPIAIGEILARRSATLLGGSPATLQGLLAIANRLPAGRIGALRLAMVTGSRLPEAVRTHFVERFATPVRNYYGLTETCGFCFGDDYEGDPDTDTIGHPVDALVRIVAEDGRDVARGEQGEMLLHSANLMLGYAGETPRVRSAWYRTGDLVRIDAHGCCRLLGRLHDIVKNGHGEIVVCRLIEDALLVIPGVADAAVLPGVDDAGFERAIAYLVPTTTPDDAESWLGEIRSTLHATLGPRRMPNPMLLRTSLPRTANGKLRLDQTSHANET